jgi:hypothetical protein
MMKNTIIPFSSRLFKASRCLFVTNRYLFKISRCLFKTNRRLFETDTSLFPLVTI